MPAPLNDLDAFYAFGREKLAADQELSFDDLVIEWDTASHRDTINEAIRQGIADVDAERTRPVSQVIAEARQSLGVDRQ